jgi:hypothetical protein
MVMVGLKKFKRKSLTNIRSSRVHYCNWLPALHPAVLLSDQSSELFYSDTDKIDKLT